MKFVERALRTNATKWKLLEHSGEAQLPPRAAYGAAAEVIFEECQRVYSHVDRGGAPPYLEDRGMDEPAELAPYFKNRGDAPPPNMP